MEIREFYGEEIRTYWEQSSVLFHSVDAYKNIEQNIEKDKNRLEGFFRLGAFEDNLLAGIEVHPYEVLFEGKPVKMGGIGGVISTLEARGKGAVKEIMNQAFKKMRQNEQYISHLFPFRGDYYRQYGYEITGDTVVWSIPVELIAKKRAGEIKLYTATDEMKQDIVNIYHKFVSDINLMRCDKDWDNFFKEITPYSSGLFSYIHYTNGTPDGFLVYNMHPYPERTDKIQDISVRYFWYTDSNGISGLLNYILGLKEYSDRVYIPCNDDLGPFCEFNAGWGKRNTERKVDFCGSTRVIDVLKILEMKEFKGNVCIKINDSQCEWNNGVFVIENGNVKKDDNALFDAECDIGTFSSLIMGRSSKISLVPGLTIVKNEKSLNELFAPRKICFDEHF